MPSKSHVIVFTYSISGNTYKTKNYAILAAMLQKRSYFVYKVSSLFPRTGVFI